MQKYTGYLAICPYCNVKHVQESKKYPGRCVDCGNRYNRYSVYKAAQKKQFSFSRQVLLDNIVFEYQCLKQNGCKVPRDIP